MNLTKEEGDKLLILVDELAIRLNGEWPQEIRDLYEAMVKLLEAKGAKNEI